MGTNIKQDSNEKVTQDFMTSEYVNCIESMKRDMKENTDDDDSDGLFTNFFAGHGITVIGRQMNPIYDESGFIVWDGMELRRYWPTEWQDCIVTYDMKLISLQRLRYFAMGNGFETIFIFPCKIGEASIELEIPGSGIWGLASYCRDKILDKEITVRDFIFNVNQLVDQMGFNQFSEVICRKEVLDCKLLSPKYKSKPFLLNIVDICRVYGKKDDFGNEISLFTP
jgi:hypothetical protein